MKINCKHTKVVSIDSLRPHPKNANTHSPEQLERLAKILQYQGWRKPIVISKLSGYIVSGHGRLLASRIAGFTEVPIDEQDYDSKEQELADLVADNRIAELSSWNDIKLNDELAELKSKLEDVEITGFDDIDLSNLAENLFRPTLEPARANGEINQDAINAVGATLSNQFTGSRQELRSVTCPSCGDDFSISVNEINR